MRVRGGAGYGVQGPHVEILNPACSVDEVGCTALAQSNGEYAIAERTVGRMTSNQPVKIVASEICQACKMLMRQRLEGAPLSRR